MWTITSGATTVRTFGPETEIFPPLDVPPARTFIDVDHAPAWDAKDTGGTQVADGVYAYTVKGQLIRRWQLPTGTTQEVVLAETAAVAGSVTLDTVNPSVSVLSPTNSGFTTATPSFSVSFADAAPSSGIATAGFVATLDSVDITSSFAVTTSGATYQVSSGSPLAAGSHTWTARCADNAGNLSAVASATFTVDVAPPVISIVQPPVPPFPPNPRDGCLLILNNELAWCAANMPCGQPRILCEYEARQRYYKGLKRGSN